MISRKDGPFLELFTATRWLDVLLCTSGTRWTSPTSLTDWASRTKKTMTLHWTADSNLVGAPNWPFFCQIQFTRVDHSSISSLQTFPQTIIESVTTTMWFLNTVIYWLYWVVQISRFHWTHHVTLVMFQSVYFVQIFICNASNARIGLPIGANS